MKYLLIAIATALACLSATFKASIRVRPSALVTTASEHFHSEWPSGSGTGVVNLDPNSGESPTDFATRIKSTQRRAFSTWPADGTSWSATWYSDDGGGCGLVHEDASREPGVPFETTILSELGLTLAATPPNCPAW